MSWQTVNVDCFQIERMNGGVASLLDSIDRSPVENRNVEIDSCPFRIERMSKFVDEGKTLYEGDFVKVRMDNLPENELGGSGFHLRDLLRAITRPVNITVAHWWQLELSRIVVSLFRNHQCCRAFKSGRVGANKSGMGKCW